MTLRARSLLAPAWGVQCAVWKARNYPCGAKALWTGQFVRLATSLPKSAHALRIVSTEVHAIVDWATFTRSHIHHVSASVRKGQDSDERKVQELLWKTFFQDRTQWWDNRQRKKSPRHPDFKHKKSGQALWLNNRCKPTWVDAQLTSLLDSSASASSSSTNHADQPIGAECEPCSTPESVKELCQQGQVEEAVKVLEVLVGKNACIDTRPFYSVLKKCVVKKDLMLGTQVHALAMKMGFGSHTFLSYHFIRMYAGHGKLQEAMDVFKRVARPDVFMWASIILGHVKHGQAKRAIELYQQMRATSMKPNGYVLRAALQACGAARDLLSGKQVHDDMLTNGIENDIVVYNCVLDMYVKCGSLTDARIVFDRLGEKDVVTWSVMIAGYARVEGKSHEALRLYRVMRNEGMVAPDATTYVSLLQACANIGVSALDDGKQFHSQLKEQGLESSLVVGCSLVNMYAKCGNLKDARVIFDELGEKDVVTWNAMMAGYARVEGMGQEALSLYSALRNEGIVAPDALTFTSLLQACANMGVSALDEGKQFHSQLKERGLESDLVVGGSLVNMYAKCGSLKDARVVFDGLVEKNVVAWNVMIAGYARLEGMAQEALSLYGAMRDEGMVAPDAVTFSSLLQACANVGVSALKDGKQLHSHLKKLGLECDLVVGGSLVNMYAKCGSLKDARVVFDGLVEKNVVTWSAMIAGYARVEGMAQEALSLYGAMRNEGMVAPDAVTFTSLLQACANVGVSALKDGKQLHSQLKQRGLESDVMVGKSLVNMYAKCGRVKDAEVVFDGLVERDAVNRTGMIAEYPQQKGMGHEALSIAIHKAGMEAPDAMTREGMDTSSEYAECNTVSQLRIQHLEYVLSESSVSIYR